MKYHGQEVEILARKKLFDKEIKQAEISSYKTRSNL